MNWTDLKTLVITNVPMEISDPNARNFSTHFYRVIPGNSIDGSAGGTRIDRVATPATKTTAADSAHNSTPLVSSTATSNPSIERPFEANLKVPRISLYGVMIPKSPETEDPINVRSRERRLALITKLSGIVLSDFRLGGALNDILLALSQESRRLDPDGRGVNFIIDRSNLNYPHLVSQTLIDPATGLPVRSDPGDIPIPVIRVTNASLGQVLDAIVKDAPRPIQYSILDYAVVFSSTPRDPAPRLNRVFKVDPNTFLENLELVTAPPEPPLSPSGPRITVKNEASKIQAVVREFFVKVGVDLQSPNCVFFNDREGSLLVHATQADMDLIEAVLPLVNVQH